MFFVNILFIFSLLIGACCVFAAVVVIVVDPSISGFLLCLLLSAPFLGIAYLMKRINKKAQDKKESKILRTRIVDTSGRTSTSSAVGRSAVGGFVAGPVGAVVGASTAKQNRETTFLITYQNGTKKTKKVPNNSVEYEMYCKFLDA